MVPKKNPIVLTRSLILAVGSRSHLAATKRSVATKPINLQQSVVYLNPNSLVAAPGQYPVNKAKTASKKLTPPITSRIDLDEPGYLRLPQVLKLLGISRSGFYKGVKDGIYPAQVKLSPNPNGRAVGWSKSSIKKLLSDLAPKA